MNRLTWPWVLLLVCGGLVLTRAPLLAASCTVEHPIDPEIYEIKHTGWSFSLKLLGFVEAEGGEHALQHIYEEPQRINNGIKVFAELYNNCRMSLADFNQNISNLVTYRKEAEAIRRLADDIDSLQEKQRSLGRDTVDLKENYQDLQRKYGSLSVALARHADESSRIWSSFELYKREVEEQLGRTLDIFSEETRKATEQQVELAVNLLTGRIDERLQDLEKRVSDLEHDVAFLLRQFNEGHLEDTHIFAGVSLMAAHVSGGIYPGVLLSAEYLYPRRSGMSKLLLGSAPFFEIGKLWWSKDDSYRTLPGMPPSVFTQDNRLQVLNAGLRKYIATDRTFHFYFGGHVGYSRETEANGTGGWTAGLLTGVEATGWSVRPALELRASALRASQETRVFDPLGGILTARDEKYRPAYAALLRTTMLVW